jgi:predicted ABC-type ATPase
VKLSKERVRLRVAKGGHHIPDEDIERRFDRSLKNLRELFLPMADQWSLVEAYTTPPVYIATFSNGELAINDRPLYLKLIGHD